MRSQTETRPKGLLPVAGQSLLTRQVAALHAAGLDEIGIVTGYRSEAFEGRGITLFHNPRWSETNMVASLACAADWLCAEPVVVSYSDIFYTSEAPSALNRANADLAITYDPHWHDLWSVRFPDPLSDAETFAVDPDGRLREIGARPRSLAEVGGQYMGLLRIKPAAWTRIETLRANLSTDRQRDQLDMTGLLRLLLEDGMWIEAVRAPWPWGEVDSESDLALYEDDPVKYGLIRP